ncbi:integrase [Sunxiuqinia dokdonensis]|uniref:Integrase n=2 Tax=Sunxiuqinia dokdonensis TaxID=1409788 RepID=A0A0L8V8R5_9BACT|nr:integrase [Sunxiuqinia dokdonensis]
MVQISKNGKRKYQSLGVSVNAKHWDFSKNKPKPNCPNGGYIQKIMLDKITELQTHILELNASQKDFTLTNLLNVNKSEVKEKTVGEFYRELILHYKQTNKAGNRLIYKGSHNSIKEFSKGRLNILFADIDIQWLQRYEKWLRSKGNKETTMSLLFRTLRSAYNKAIESKAANKTNYPFNEFKISKFDIKTKKRSITKDDILKLMNLDLSAETESVRFSRDVFIFSYLSGGINFTDIANLRFENIVDRRLKYIRQKTGKKIGLIISQTAIDLLKPYQRCENIENYLFPILDTKRHKTAIQKQNRIHKILVRVNKDLKRVAELAKIDFNLSTYVARHSFATVLKNSGVDIALISETLGHSDLSTTQIYLDSFENEQIKGAMDHLL